MKGRTPSSVESARSARKSVGRARRNLIRPSPQALEGCIPHLRCAIDALSQVQQAASGGGEPAGTRRALQLEMAQLDRELSQLNALMRNASLLFEGWSRLVFPEECAEYHPAGRRPLQPVPTLRLEG